MKKYSRDLLIILFLSALPAPILHYRVMHPEKTETQLFFDILKAYKEFFFTQ